MSGGVCAVMLVKVRERFFAKVEFAPAGCWVWTGYIDQDGYGRFTAGARRGWRAHRFAYEMFVAPIPAGLTIDHLCRNRACVNPAHLQAVTNRVNVLRGQGAPAQNARKDRCHLGHLLEGENVYRYPDGRRCCRICRRAYIREYMRARRAA